MLGIILSIAVTFILTLKLKEEKKKGAGFLWFIFQGHVSQRVVVTAVKVSR